MATYKEQLDAVWEKYRKEVSHDPVDLKTVAAWAIAHSGHIRPVIPI